MKNYSGKMSKAVHSQLKAAASDNDMTIPDFIEYAVAMHLHAAGYKVPPAYLSEAAAADSQKTEHDADFYTKQLEGSGTA